MTELWECYHQETQAGQSPGRLVGSEELKDTVAPLVAIQILDIHQAPPSNPPLGTQTESWTKLVQQTQHRNLSFELME